jgi:universal stress protein A
MGSVSTGILRAAVEYDADLIVMGSHGRSGPSRLLLGSVAEAVMRKASCPVLVVTEPRPEAVPASPAPASHSVVVY